MSVSGGVEVQQRVGSESTNFILRRAVPFLPKPPPPPLPPHEEWQEIITRDSHYEYERSPTLEDRSRCGNNHIANDVARNAKPKAPSSTSNDVGKMKDVGHKTVIYFGDSTSRQKENRAARQRPPSPEVGTSSGYNEGPETSVRSQRDDEATEVFKSSVERHENGNNEDNSGQQDATPENGESKVVHEIVVNVSPSREDVLRIEEDESQLEDYWSLPGDRSGFKADWSFVQQWRLRG